MMIKNVTTSVKVKKNSGAVVFSIKIWKIGLAGCPLTSS